MRKRLYEIIEIGKPDDKASLVYDRIMLVLIVISLVPLCFNTSNNIFFLIDIITTGVFIIDYILRWITADYGYTKSKIIAFLRYPFTIFAIFDLLSILPVLTILNSGFRLLKIFRLFKALKSLKILRYSKSFNIILNVVKKQKDSLLAVCYLACGYVLLSAMIMFQVEPQNFPTFFDAIYWATVTLTTVGYGDIYPLTNIGRIVSMVSSLVGIAIVAMPAGIISAGFMSELQEDKNKK